MPRKSSSYENTAILDRNAVPVDDPARANKLGLARAVKWLDYYDDRTYAKPLLFGFGWWHVVTLLKLCWAIRLADSGVSVWNVHDSQRSYVSTSVFREPFEWRSIAADGEAVSGTRWLLSRRVCGWDQIKRGYVCPDPVWMRWGLIFKPVTLRLGVWDGRDRAEE